MYISNIFSPFAIFYISFEGVSSKAKEKEKEKTENNVKNSLYVMKRPGF